MMRKLNLNPQSYLGVILELLLLPCYVIPYCAFILQKSFLLGKILKGEHFYKKQFTSNFSAFSLPPLKNVCLNKFVLPCYSSSRFARNCTEIIFLHPSAGLERYSESWTQPSN